MKTKKIIVVALLLTRTMVAQTDEKKPEDDKKGYIGISLGSSTPLGDFGSTDIDNDAAGFAAQGFMFDASFGYRLAKNFGTLILIRVQENQMDAQALVDGFHKMEPTLSWSAQTSSYSLLGAMAGGFLTFPLGSAKKSNLDIKGGIGFLSADFPETKITGTDGINSVTSKIESTSASAFSYMLGVGYRFNMNKYLCLMINIDYLGANPEFKNVKTTLIDDSTGDVISTDINTFSQSFGTINYTGGIGFRIK